MPTDFRTRMPTCRRDACTSFGSFGPLPSGAKECLNLRTLDVEDLVIEAIVGSVESRSIAFDMAYCSGRSRTSVVQGWSQRRLWHRVANCQGRLNCRAGQACQECIPSMLCLEVAGVKLQAWGTIFPQLRSSGTRSSDFPHRARVQPVPSPGCQVLPRQQSSSAAAPGCASDNRHPPTAVLALSMTLFIHRSLPTLYQHPHARPCTLAPATPPPTWNSA